MSCTHAEGISRKNTVPADWCTEYVQQDYHKNNQKTIIRTNCQRTVLYLCRRNITEKQHEYKGTHSVPAEKGTF
jgi:hypothetical protein